MFLNTLNPAQSLQTNASIVEQPSNQVRQRVQNGLFYFLAECYCSIVVAPKALIPHSFRHIHASTMSLNTLDPCPISADKCFHCCAAEQLHESGSQCRMACTSTELLILFQQEIGQ